MGRRYPSDGAASFEKHLSARRRLDSRHGGRGRIDSAVVDRERDRLGANHRTRGVGRAPDREPRDETRTVRAGDRFRSGFRPHRRGDVALRNLERRLASGARDDEPDASRARVFPERRLLAPFRRESVLHRVRSGRLTLLGRRETSRRARAMRGALRDLGAGVRRRRRRVDARRGGRQKRCPPRPDRSRVRSGLRQTSGKRTLRLVSSRRGRFEVLPGRRQAARGGAQRRVRGSVPEERLVRILGERFFAKRVPPRRGVPRSGRRRKTRRLVLRREAPRDLRERPRDFVLERPCEGFWNPPFPLRRRACAKRPSSRRYPFRNLHATFGVLGDGPVARSRRRRGNQRRLRDSRRQVRRHGGRRWIRETLPVPRGVRVVRVRGVRGPRLARRAGPVQRRRVASGERRRRRPVRVSVRPDQTGARRAAAAGGSGKAMAAHGRKRQGFRVPSAGSRGRGCVGSRDVVRGRRDGVASAGRPRGRLRSPGG